MKILNTLYCLFLILFFLNLNFAQTNSNLSSRNIAVIDTSLFDDPEKGVKLLAKAKRSYHIEYFEIHSLKKSIEAVKKEIELLLEQNKPINEKFTGLERLKKELDDSEKAKTKEIVRKWSLVITPIENKIKEKLKEFASKKGFTILIEKNSTGFLIESDIEDVTFEFIKFCNDSFSKENK